MMNGTYDVQVSTWHGQEKARKRFSFMMPNFFIKSNKCINAFHSCMYLKRLHKEAVIVPPPQWVTRKTKPKKQTQWINKSCIVHLVVWQHGINWKEGKVFKGGEQRLTGSVKLWFIASCCYSVLLLLSLSPIKSVHYWSQCPLVTVNFTILFHHHSWKRRQCNWSSPLWVVADYLFSFSCWSFSARGPCSQIWWTSSRQHHA